MLLRWVAGNPPLPTFQNLPMTNETIFVLFEGLLIFGGALAFGIWQLRSIKKDQEKARAAKKQDSQSRG